MKRRDTIVRYTAPERINHWVTAFCFVLAAVSGLGIAWIPDWLAAQEVEQGRLRCILPQSASVTFAISAVWPEAPWVPQKIRVTIDALLAGLPQAIRQTGGHP